MLVVLVIAALATGLGMGLRYGVRDDVWPRNFGVVSEGQVYRAGRQTPASMKRLVERYKIKTIVDLGAYAPGSPEERAAAGAAAALGVRRVRVSRDPVGRQVLHGDGTGDPNLYVVALRIMTDPASQPVLVHCAAGAQRTGACVMLYRLALEGKPFEETYAEAQRYRHDPARNPYLMAYLKEWGAKIVDALPDRKPIPYHAVADGVRHDGGE